MRQKKGFTLIELMMVIAVMGIFLGLAVPGFRELILSNRMAAASNNLTATLNYARNEAIKRGTGVSVCSSTNQTSCSANSWSSGWMVFLDNNNTGVVQQASDILRVFKPKASMTVTLSGVNYIHFQGSGTLLTESEPFKYTHFAALDLSPMSSLSGSGVMMSDVIILASSDNGNSGNDNGNSGNDNGNSGDGSDSGGNSGNNGNSSSSSSSTAPASLQVCDSSRSGETGSQINISNTGRVSIVKITCP